MINNRIIDYYNQTDISYRILWGIDRNLSIHYGFFDEAHRGHDDALVNMNRILARTGKITKDDLVVDAGCGVGGSSFWLAQHCGAKVIGLNINEMQIERARRIAATNNLNRQVEFLIRDFSDSKLPDESCDVVWGLESICYASDKKTFLAEAKRMLRANGRIVIADFFLNDKQFATDKEISVWLNGWAIPNLSSTASFNQYLEDLDFKNITFRNITENVVPSSKRIYIISLISRPIGRFLELIGCNKKMFTGNPLSSYYQYTALRRKLWSYGIFYAERE